MPDTKPPAKKWRVTWPDGNGDDGNSRDYRTESAAYADVHTITSTGILTARVYQWDKWGERWVLYEIVNP